MATSQNNMATFMGNMNRYLLSLPGNLHLGHEQYEQGIIMSVRLDNGHFKMTISSS